MPFEKNIDQIVIIAHKIISETDAFREKVSKGSYTEDELVTDVVAKADSIWEGAASAIAEFDRTESEIAAAQAQWQAAWPEKPEPADVRNRFIETVIGVLMSINSLYFLFLIGFANFQIYRHWGSNSVALSKGATWLVISKYFAVFVVLTVLVGIFKSRSEHLTAADLERKTKEWKQAKDDLKAKFGLPELMAQQTSEALRIESDLAVRITEEIRAAINRHTEPNYTTILDIERPRDFGEVSDSRFIVPTPAREALDRLLAHLSGGSIGISGSRGAGKSTLLRSYCGDTRVVTSLRDQNTGKDMKVLGVLVSAPVAYQAREFLLYLFGAVCQSALEAEGVAKVEPTMDAGGAPREATKTWLASPEMRAAPRVLVHYGAMLSLFGLLLSLFIAIAGSDEPAAELSEAARERTAAASPASAPTTVASPTPPPAATVTTSRPAHDADRPLAAASARSQKAPASPVATQHSAPGTATPADFAKFIARWLAAMKIDPGTMLTWGAGSVLLGLAFGGILGQPQILLLVHELPFGLGVLFRGFPQAKRILSHERIEEMERRERKNQQHDKDLSRLARIAGDRLKSIKFQQSYTSGWSGSLKLPLGLEAGTSNAVTMAQNQLSMPEIASSFARFIKEVATANYKVVIGIDELDKIATDELARQFINDIKSIFGLPNCFYLVSVSEDAMSSFERRGLPIRDEFDSAFDELIYVEHLKFNVARTLLEQRLLGRPIPFFALSYCMSGGLPRDLIRSFRKVLDVDGKSPGLPPSLSAVCNQLVTNDIVAKALAVRTAARKIKLPNEINILVTAMREIEGSAGVDDALETLAKNMLDPAFFMKKTEVNAEAEAVISRQQDDGSLKNTENGEDNEAEGALKQLYDLVEEIATYILYVVVIRRIFTDKLSQADLDDAIVRGEIDKLAQARRYIGVNPGITRVMLDGWKI